ncbi:hypothetical protein [Asticcacaulis endophyticus]|uniref:Uncharacterized protein n=1 Tax=Asticcacaulis endophyticus TaxID=1395890 RepID=A0A918Q3Q0_9CAUL|nr:hypothetical protein [Asticcacaulis endophyticus]GGZ32737.1 hypothetical protein GCM10011273_18690 [Asticcacaulis endophyticus]
MNKAISWWMTVFGAFLAATTFLSIVSHAFSVPISHMFTDLIEFYRGLFRPIIDMVQVPFLRLLDALGFHFSVPGWFKDLHILSFIGGGIFARAEAGTPNQGRDPKIWPFAMLLSGLFMGSVGLGILFLLGLPRPIGYFIGSWAGALGRGRAPVGDDIKTTSFEAGNKYIYGREGFAMLIAGIVIFATNATFSS